MLLGGLPAEAAGRYLHCFIGKIIAALHPGRWRKSGGNKLCV